MYLDNYVYAFSPRMDFYIYKNTALIQELLSLLRWKLEYQKHFSISKLNILGCLPLHVFHYSLTCAEILYCFHFICLL